MSQGSGRALTNFWAVVMKELRSYFLSPFIYLMAAVFLLLSGYYFYTDLIFYVQFGFGMNIMSAFWQLFFTDLRLVVLLTVPFLTIRLFTEEKRLGTIELLLTYPMRDSELFWGKFVACSIATLFILSFTIVYPILLYSVQPFDWTVTIAGYTGVGLHLPCLHRLWSLYFFADRQSWCRRPLGLRLVAYLFWILSWNDGAMNQGVLRMLAEVSMVYTFSEFRPRVY